jgi:hypothetical protein
MPPAPWGHGSIPEVKGVHVTRGGNSTRQRVRQAAAASTCQVEVQCGSKDISAIQYGTVKCTACSMVRALSTCQGMVCT